MNINNLAAVPSIVFGILGLSIFINFMGLPRSAALVGGMVLALMTSLAITVVSGIALYGATDFAGPLAGMFRGELAADVLEGLHELGANLTLLLVILHLGGVLVGLAGDYDSRIFQFKAR